MERTHVDQMNRLVKIPSTPKKIISLVPSQSELLYDLGLKDRLSGITKYCDHPTLLKKEIALIGGTKKLDIHKIEALAPDLIIANKEENVKDQVLALAEKYPTWISDVKDLATSLDMVKKIGLLTNTLEKAEDISSRINNSFKSLQTEPQIDVAYLIWRKPYMTVGGDTFISNMLELAGFRNIFCNKERYPPTDLDQLANSDAKVIFLSSEPYPFKEKHQIEIQQRCSNSIILLVDGTYFSWYGSRLEHSPAYFRKIRNAITQKNE